MTFFVAMFVVGLVMLFAKEVLDYDLSGPGTDQQRRQTFAFFLVLMLCLSGVGLFPVVDALGVARLTAWFGFAALVGISLWLLFRFRPER